MKEQSRNNVETIKNQTWIKTNESSSIDLYSVSVQLCLLRRIKQYMKDVCSLDMKACISSFTCPLWLEQTQTVSHSHTKYLFHTFYFSCSPCSPPASSKNTLMPRLGISKIYHNTQGFNPVSHQ